jgi:hypothetical protein
MDERPGWRLEDIYDAPARLIDEILARRSARQKAEATAAGLKAQQVRHS